MIINFNKKILPPLLLLFFILFKAEFSYSAFFANSTNSDSLLIDKKIDLAKKLILTEEYSKSLKILLPLSDKEIGYRNIETNFLIGEIFKKTKDYKKSIFYFKKSLYLNRLETLPDGDKYIKPPDLISIKFKTLLSLSGVYLNKQEIDSSSFFLEKLISIKNNDRKKDIYLGDAYNNLSVINFKYKKDYKTAEDYIKKAIKVHNTIVVDKELKLSGDYANLANIYSEKGNFEKAKKIYLQALKIVEPLNTIQVIEHKELLYDNLAWILYKLKDYRAFEYLDKSILLREEIRNDNIKREVKKIEARHNVDLIKKAAENKQLKLERNVWITGIIGIVVSLLLLFLASMYKLRQYNLSLKLSKNELEKQRELDELKSESQIKIINATIDGKETERKEIAETLHDNVSALLSSANMHLQATKKRFKGEELPSELQKTQQIISEASQQIRDLSHTLMSSVLLKFGLAYAVKDIAQKYSNSDIKIHSVTNNVHRYTQNVEIKIFNIIQELINNVLKHSKAKNTYTILEEITGDKLLIVVKDDGIGFNDENKKGIGLNQIKARIQMLNGELEVKSNAKQGTKISIIIPIEKNRLT